jgi:UPF0755 protein
MKLRSIISIVLVVIVVAASVYGYMIFRKIFDSNTSFSDRQTYVYIPTNATYPEAEKIISEYVNDIEKFRMSAEKMSYPQNVRPGRFLLKSGMNNFDIIKALRVNVPVKVTFNNQERIEDFAARISQQIEPDSLTILQVITEQDFLSSIEISQDAALTMFIPNTYEFYWNTTASQFREKMLNEYRRFWNEERLLKAAALNMTPEQVSILASIVQKETVKVDERPKVAGAYLNRLRIGMPLQADPTAVYAYKKNTNNFNQVIKRVMNFHTQIESPYNTYMVAGLPPGPIAMPDISSIDAVLNYEKHDFIYFCASVERFGYHEFAKTLTQHNINAAKYQRWLNKQGY